MNLQYRVVGADQREYGPAGADELRRWIAEGRVNAQSMIQTEGVPGWRALGSDPDFAGALLAPAPIAPQAFAPIPVQRTNGLAVTGFIIGLFGLLLCCCGPVPSVSSRPVAIQRKVVAGLPSPASSFPSWALGFPASAS
jgi:hypothetical protein